MQTDETKLRKLASETITRDDPDAPPAESGPDEVQIGNYRLLKEIGRGGMGIVYLGEQVSLKRQVAIKTLPREMAHDDEFLQRIENEARILAKFSNPNIVYIHDQVTQGDAIYLIMEYVPGITVADRLRTDGPYAIDEAARIVIRVAVALEHAHSKGIIHRDIKPSNIMIRRDDVVKVTDFGIAKSSEGSDITRIRFTPGTRDYMSPEQARGLRDIDGRSDIYSLGVVFYLMVTGTLPPYPVPTRLPSVPPIYERIILKCLAEDPAARYQTAKELIVALDQAKEEATHRKRTPRTGGRKPGWGLPLLIAAIVVIVASGVAVWQMDAIIQRFSGTPQEPIGRDVKPAETPVEPQPIEAVPSQPPPPIDTIPVSPPPDEALQTDAADRFEPAAPTEAMAPLAAPMLRPAADRRAELATAIGGHPGVGLPGGLRPLFALKTGVVDVLGGHTDLAFGVVTLLDQLDVVRRIDQGGCDLLVEMDAVTRTVMLSSNLFGDDQVATYRESFTSTDDQGVVATLEAFIRKYYCFHVLGAMQLVNSMGPGFGADITLNGGSGAMVSVGTPIDICLNADREAYSVLLSVNAEGIFMLFPQMRDEQIPIPFRKPFCTGPMTVSPPTGVEMVAAILYLDKGLLSIDGYLAGDDQVIVEPASWSYAPYAPNSAVEFCEGLVAGLLAAPADRYAAVSRSVRTHD